MKTITMIMLAASRTAAAAFAPRTSLAFASTAGRARSYSRSAAALMAGNPKGRILVVRTGNESFLHHYCLSKLSLLSSVRTVFFDMEIGGEPAGRIEFELRADGP
jgi:hypothetical protein